MRLPQICIEQPVLAIVLNLVLVILGFIGYQQLDIRYFPEVNMPVMSIGVYYQGASPELMENNVTIPLENAVAGVAGIDTISSSSSTSRTSITIKFRENANFQEGVNEVRDKVSGARDKIPADANSPTISVGGTEGTSLSIGFTSSKMDPSAIRDYVSHYVSPQLREIAGVGAVSIQGASAYALRIWLDAEKMAALGVTATDVKGALVANNIDFPAGSMQDPQRTYSVVSDTRLQSVDSFKNTIIKNVNGRMIRVKDIAHVELGKQSLQDSPMRINGIPAVDVEVKPLKNANPIDVAKAVRKALVRIKANLPKAMQAKVNYDQSEFLEASIHETFMAIFEAVILVVLVVFLFLGSLRASLVPIITIPLCIAAVFAVMLLFGFSINVMTLLAVVLAIGLVVDDAIVMLENIYRYIERGMEPYAAAMTGSKQIAFAVVAMTITLAAVYAPIGFASGPSAVFFQEFAFTLAGAVVISGWVALTLSPMMCSKILKLSDQDSALTKRVDKIFEKLDAFYQGFLHKVLQHKRWIILALLGIAVLGIGVFKIIPSEFVPKEDTGLILVSVQSPAGSSINYTDRYMREIEKEFAKIPETAGYYAMIWSGSALTYLTLKPWQERERSTQEITAELTPKLAKIPGVNAYPYVPDPIDYGDGGGNTAADVTLQLMTAGNYRDLQEPLNKLQALAKKYPGFTNVNISLKYESQQYQLTINRDVASDLNVNVQDIADTISVMLGGSHVTDLDSDGRNYQVIVQITKDDLKNFVGLNKLYVRNLDVVPKMIPLSSLVKLTPDIGQSSLQHFNRMRSANISAQLAPGYTVSQGVDFIQKTLSKVLHSQIRYAFDGKAAQYLASSGSMVEIFVLALLFIYLVLAAQFGSFIDPFIILFTVPLCIVGALFTLLISGGTLNLFSEIGLVTLVGLISKHGILITQFVNELRTRGIGLEDAIVQGAATRLRPILMTTMAMVLGSIPLAIATGPGSVGRNQIGWVIVGGMLLGTFFSLVVVPVAYAYLGKFKQVKLLKEEAE